MKHTIKSKLDQARPQPSYEFQQAVEDALDRLPPMSEPHSNLRRPLMMMGAVAALLAIALPIGMWHLTSPRPDPPLQPLSESGARPVAATDMPSVAALTISVSESGITPSIPQPAIDDQAVPIPTVNTPDEAIPMPTVNTNNVVTQPQISPNTAKQIQLRLTELGFFRGISDGNLGPVSVISIRKFQQAVGLEATGIPDAETQARMFSEDAPNGPYATMPTATPSPTPITEDLRATWRNILLLGMDSGDMSEPGRSDVIVIASVNTDSGAVKLVSVMPDTVLNIPGYGEQKINEATALGGPSLLVELLNEKLQANITGYVMIGYAGTVNMIDALGGVYLDITSAEMDEINARIGDVAQYTMEQQAYLAQRDELTLDKHGTNILLGGIQATTFARIRNLDSDYRRTERHRELLDAIVRRIEGATANQLLSVILAAWGIFDTDLEMDTAVSLSKVAANVSVESIMSWRMPGSETATERDGDLGQGFYDVDCEELAYRLNKFIYDN